MPRVLGLGSSLVACTLGYNWINDLVNVEFVNHGINGAHIPGVIQTLALVKDVSAVLLIVGGNDLSSSLPELVSNPGYSKMIASRLGRPLSSPTQFKADLDELLSLIKSTYSVPVLVADLKPIGENLSGSLNILVRTYNEIIVQSVSEHDCVHLPLYDSLVPLANQGITMTGANPSNDINSILDVKRMMTVYGLYKASFGMYSLNTLGESRGFYSTCDGSHFNERSGKVVAQLVQSTLDRVLKA